MSIHSVAKCGSHADRVIGRLRAAACRKQRRTKSAPSAASCSPPSTTMHAAASPSAPSATSTSSPPPHRWTCPAPTAKARRTASRRAFSLPQQPSPLNPAAACGSPWHGTLSRQVRTEVVAHAIRSQGLAVQGQRCGGEAASTARGGRHEGGSLSCHPSVPPLMPQQCPYAALAL